MERTIDVKPAANQLPSIETVPAKPTPVRKTAGLESTFNCKDSNESSEKEVHPGNPAADGACQLFLGGACSGRRVEALLDYQLSSATCQGQHY